ncbi:eukaryotic translation initiation factor 2-alpha kinase 1-like [Babylonia areolata]|uniref:eukaryotic translation initiation factor 2-alpha kinase 1-like n=1 Tax=Babylonia areolata TaxID=304850 RepID=UPI003FD151D5
MSQQLLREVQALAKLSHSFSHIVGYNTAWLEGSSRTASAESSSKESSEVSDEENSPATTDDRPMQAKQTSKTNSDSDGVEFAHREDEENRRGSASTSVKKPHGPAENSTVDNNVLMGKQGSPALQHQNFPNVKVDLINVDNCGKVEDGGDANPGLSQMNVNDVTKEEENSQPKSTITLYIQMELCRKTLYDWIIQRNDRLKSDQELRSKSSDIMRVFHEITEGVAYIHSHDIIHRDLKPLNIFLQGTGQVKIGDFGLAKEYLPSSLSERQEGFTVAGEHSEGVGTETYAAPEQIKGTRYDNKCDMYSLGIILFEMCNRFTTDMERYKTINDVRQERMPEQFTKQWPKQEELVQKLTSQTPADRPTAKTVLDWLEQELQDTVTAKETKIATQAEQIATQERKIAAQAEQIAAQEREIVTQAKKIEAQAKEIDQLRKQLEDTKK